MSERNERKNWFTYEMSALTIIAMLIYGFIALCSETISFNLQIAVGLVIGVFFLEIVAGITQMIGALR